ncbi:MAG: class I SAM-dependent methyltransferase [Polyangiaceae bacterium]|jgi:SAM-dependent methyltransferase|nr:class I SAM-dependent methyltransferase [Polyangiaceae bacterium]
MSLYQKILGLPFVYNRVRPLVVGGIDMAPVYGRLGAGAGDVVLDVGCGTGVALDFLGPVSAYVGVDTDPVALTFARERTAPPGVEISFLEGLLAADEVERLRPHVAVLAGLLHHVDDAGCVELLRMLRRSDRLRRVVTLDITFLPHRFVNNLFSLLDRGQYCRHPGGYEALAREAGFDVEEGAVVPAGPRNRRVAYWSMILTPRAGA